MHIVEPLWRLLVEQRQPLWRRRRVDGRAWHAHLPSLRELRVRLRVLVVTSSESLSTAGLSRCPRTVLKAQLLLFATCTGEANALRKSRLRDELLLVKAQLRFFGTVAGKATTVTRSSWFRRSRPTPHS